jgi:hypothetical protein
MNLKGLTFFKYNLSLILTKLCANMNIWKYKHFVNSKIRQSESNGLK